MSERLLSVKNHGGQLYGIARRLVGWALPQACLLCGGWPGAGGEVLCGSCAGALPRLPGEVCSLCASPLPAGSVGSGRCGRCLARASPITGMTTALRYEREAAWLVRRFKFHGALVAGRVLARCLVERLDTGEVAPDCVVPVPLHRRRLRERGFDQALVLARDVGGAFGLPVRVLLERARATEAQSGMADAVARRRNVRQVFRATGSAAGQRVTLLDDVVTTGATAEEAARTLLRAGAVSVQVWCCARTTSAV